MKILILCLLIGSISAIHHSQKPPKDIPTSRAATGCVDSLTWNNSDCKKLKLTCTKLKSKCYKTFKQAVGNSSKGKKCQKKLQSKANKRVHTYCKETCQTCKNGKWSAWGDYSPCTKTCGDSVERTRTRTCTNPAPSGGGNNCVGSSSESIGCILDACPVRVGEVGSGWVDICAEGEICDDGNGNGGGEVGVPPPTGEECAEGEVCGEGNGEGEGEGNGEGEGGVDCQWGDWNTLDESYFCTKSCGSGTRTKTRTKTVVESNGGTCNGSTTHTETCNTQQCPVDCQWGDWNTGSCTKSCGGGILTKTRTKTVVEANGGICYGSTTHNEACNIQQCPVDCQWGDWNMGSCTKSCEGGTLTKTRTKTVVEANGGTCTGSTTHTETCNTQQCSVETTTSEVTTMETTITTEAETTTSEVTTMETTTTTEVETTTAEETTTTTEDSKSISIDCEAPYEEITVDGSKITSPNYPNDYGRNKDCRVTIKFATGHMVAIRFDDFEVEPYGDCKFDYLSVHDGNSTSSPLIEFLCGISPRGTTLQSTGNVMTLHFFADAFGSKYKGFEIYAYAVTAANTTTETTTTEATTEAMTTEETTTANANTNALCGDYPEHIEKHYTTEQMELGTVSLSNGQTYTSCRKLCKASYPDFEFYHKFVSIQSCRCIKMKTGYEIQIQENGAYTFGYATACDNSSDSNWIIGDKDETCQTVCRKNFKICYADEQTKITTEDLFKAAMLDAGYQNADLCTNHTQRGYYGAPFLADGGKTCVSLKNDSKSVCGANDERARNSQRLCFCGRKTCVKNCDIGCSQCDQCFINGRCIHYGMYTEFMEMSCNMHGGVDCSDAHQDPPEPDFTTIRPTTERVTKRTNKHDEWNEDWNII